MQVDRKFNIGISILKLLACFVVVGIHEGLVFRWSTYAVQIFMVTAFFLSGNRFTKRFVA